MLTPADATLVRRDPHLPGLSLLLDVEALSARLSPFLPEPGGAILKCSYLRYKPGTNCLAAYRVQPASPAAAPLHLYAKAFRSGADPKLWKGATTDRPSSLAGPIVLQDAAISIRVFPDDDRLEAVALLASAGRGKLLRKLLPDRPDLREAVPEVVRYKPERRCVLRLDGPDGARASIRCYAPSEFARADSQTFRSTGALRIPQRLGRSKRHRLLAFEWLTGRPLPELLDTSAAPLIRRVGAALAELHVQDLQGLRFTTRRGEGRELQTTAAGLAFLCPQLMALGTQLARTLADRLLDAPPMAYPLHGDFYADQVLVSGNEIVVLDLDETAFGDPAADLGNFRAHLDWQSERGQLSADAVESLMAALLQGYRQTLKVAPDRIALYRAAGLLRLAHHPFRTRHPDWPQQTEALLTRAERSLPSSERSVHRRRRGTTWSPAPDVEVSDPFEIAKDPKLSFAAPALDPEQVVRRFRRTLSRSACPEGELALRAIRVTRHKPGRRCLTEYDFGNSGQDGDAAALSLIGKVRAKRPDLVSYRIQQALFSGSFGREAADGAIVPEPLGVVPKWHMWLQRKVVGQRATHLLETERSAALARRIAEAIHKLHRNTLPLRRRHTPRDELQILRERLPKVTRSQREWREPIERILEACDGLAARLPENEAVCIHRDFYPDQVLVAGDRIAVLDLDLCCQGDPALDIGNFDAHLTEQALRRFGRPDALSAAQTAFIDRYAELAGDGVRPPIDAYATLALVRHIYISTLVPDRRHLTEMLIELCAERLGVRLRCGPRVAPTASTDSPALFYAMESP